MTLVGDLLEKAARAVPAAIEERSAGWWMRYTDNATWWSGAVLAHGEADELARRIATAERFYAERDVVTRFQVCADCPDALDQALAERRYRWASPISLLTMAASTQLEPNPVSETMVRVNASLSSDWLAVLSAASRPGTDVEHETRLLGRVNRPQSYVTVHVGGEPVGIGRAVIDGDWTGVFSMATIPAMRRRGIARLVLSALVHWAEAQASARLYLQVERSNHAACRLYADFGFDQLATYHYRVQAEK